MPADVEHLVAILAELVEVIGRHAGPDPELLAAFAASRLCGMGQEAWMQCYRKGLVPRPVTISRRLFWRRRELLRWIEAGCPARKEWEAAEGSPKEGLDDDSAA